MDFHVKEEMAINEFFSGVLENSILTTAIIAWFIAQLTKTIVFAIQERKIDFRRLVGAGGMPSSHSAFVTSLATGVGIVEGWQSSMFAIASAFAVIVMYDAAGVRRAAGKQAQVLNQIVQDVYEKDFHPERLKELLGHTPFEVLIGGLFGILFVVYSMN